MVTYVLKTAMDVTPEPDENNINVLLWFRLVKLGSCRRRWGHRGWAAGWGHRGAAPLGSWPLRIARFVPRPGSCGVRTEGGEGGEGRAKVRPFRITVHPRAGQDANGDAAALELADIRGTPAHLHQSCPMNVARSICVHSNITSSPFVLRP